MKMQFGMKWEIFIIRCIFQLKKKTIINLTNRGIENNKKQTERMDSNEKRK